MTLSVFFLAAVPFAWLVPNHYPPWLSAWSDAWALGSLAAALICAPRASRVSFLGVGFLGLAGVSAVAQMIAGRIYYTGDGWMVLLYLVALGASMHAGATLVGQTDCTVHHTGPIKGQLDAWAGAIVAAATVSVGIACAQWTSAVDLGIWAADLPPPPLGRPFGNVAQPNHLCTLCFLGLCALGILYERAAVRGAAFWLAACWLLWGMVMTGSRTGWLQAGFMVASLLMVHQRCRLTMPRSGLVTLAVVFVISVVIWPNANRILMLSADRSLEETEQSGTRPRHWATILDAITRRPALGYGWSQVSAAQLESAADHPYVGEHIEHSHNIALDLMVWTGVPIGSILTVLALGWWGSRWRRCRDPRAAWALVAISGLLIHGMLEFPLEYAYFLIPFGLLIGVVDGLSPGKGGIVVGMWPARAVGAVLVGALLLVGRDYVQAEQAIRLFRLESARIGVNRTEVPVPRLPVLTQLEAFLVFTQTEALPGLPQEDLEKMRRAAERFAYPPSLFRYAVALGLNGRPDDAAMTLERLCLIHEVRYCRQAQEGWVAVQARWPVLEQVAVPVLPYIPDAQTARP